jgi:hypothetical protein
LRPLYTDIGYARSESFPLVVASQRGDHRLGWHLGRCRSVILFAAYHILKDLSRTRHASGMVNVEGEDSVAETWTYGTLRRIRGTDVAVLDLQSQQSYSLNFASGKVAEATRNLLFIDTPTGSRRWLLGNNESLIAQYEFLPREYDADSEAQPVTLIVYNIVPADTDGDGRLDYGDKRTLIVSRPDGSGNTELFRNVDAINGYVLRRPDVLLVAYEDDRKVHLATVRIADFTVVADEVVALPDTRS